MTSWLCRPNTVVGASTRGPCARAASSNRGVPDTPSVALAPSRRKTWRPLPPAKGRSDKMRRPWQSTVLHQTAIACGPMAMRR